MRAAAAVGAAVKVTAGRGPRLPAGSGSARPLCGSAGPGRCPKGLRGWLDPHRLCGVGVAGARVPRAEPELGAGSVPGVSVGGLREAGASCPLLVVTEQSVKPGFDPLPPLAV